MSNNGDQIKKTTIKVDSYVGETGEKKEPRTSQRDLPQEGDKNQCKHQLDILLDVLSSWNKDSKQVKEQALQVIEKVPTECRALFESIKTLLEENKLKEALQACKNMLKTRGNKIKRAAAEKLKRIKNKNNQPENKESPAQSEHSSDSDAVSTPKSSPTSSRPVIFAAVVKVRQVKSKRDDPASLFGQASSYWIGEQKEWETTREKMGIQLISDLPADGEAEVVIAYSTVWSDDLPKNSFPVQKALKEKTPEKSEIYQLPRECTILSYGFQKG